MAPKDNPVYISVDYSEALNSKKEVLSSEIILLNVVKSIKNYKMLRRKESLLKQKIYNLIKETDLKIKETLSLLPAVKLPKKKEEETVLEREYHRNSDDIELQLKEIQEKLNQLGY